MTGQKHAMTCDNGHLLHGTPVDWSQYTNDGTRRPILGSTASGFLEQKDLPMTNDHTASTAARKPVSKRMRFEVLKRDGHACRYCGATAPTAKLVVDHVVPVALGGTNDPSNLTAACADCNSGKSSTSANESTLADVSDLAIRMAQALVEVAEQRRGKHARNEELLGKFYDRWVGIYGYGNYSNLEAGWDGSIATFLARGLDEGDLFRFLYAPQARKVRAQAAWRYFCGCCWSEIATRQELATQLMAATTPADLPVDVPWYADPYCARCDGDGVHRSGDSYDECNCLAATPYIAGQREYGEA